MPSSCCGDCFPDGDHADLTIASAAEDALAAAGAGRPLRHVRREVAHYE